MAKKPCKIKVKLPNGEEIVPELGNQLVQKFGSAKGEAILNAILSKDFYEYFGNFLNNPKSEFFQGKLDNQNMPLLEYVLKFKEEILDKRKTNLKEKYLGKKVAEITDLKLKYVQQSVDTIRVQIKEFNRTKGAKDIVENLKDLEKLLEDYTVADNEKAFITFLDNAAEDTAKILSVLDKIGDITNLDWKNAKVREQKSKLVQDMYKYIKGYGDLATQILNDYNANAEMAEGLDILSLIHI